MTGIPHQPNGDRILKRAALVGTIVGMLLGIAAFVFGDIFPIWLPIMPPPEKPVKLLAYHSNAFEEDTLYIRTISGNIYAYGSSFYGAGDAKWRKVEQVNQEASKYQCVGKFSTPNPPGKVVGQVEGHPCVMDSSTQVNHVILEDGSIWRWVKSVPEFEEVWALLGLSVYVIIGGGLGVIAGLLIGIANWKLRRT